MAGSWNVREAIRWARLLGSDSVQASTVVQPVVVLGEHTRQLSNEVTPTFVHAATIGAPGAGFNTVLYIPPGDTVVRIAALQVQGAVGGFVWQVGTSAAFKAALGAQTAAISFSPPDPTFGISKTPGRNPAGTNNVLFTSSVPTANVPPTTAAALFALYPGAFSPGFWFQDGGYIIEVPTGLDFALVDQTANEGVNYYMSGWQMPA